MLLWARIRLALFVDLRKPLMRRGFYLLSEREGARSIDLAHITLLSAFTASRTYQVVSLSDRCAFVYELRRVALFKSENGLRHGQDRFWRYPLAIF